MLIIPAIDLRHGRCVRLRRGEAEHETVYSDDPLAIATSFVDGGATYLHVVDLDGAFSGHSENRKIIAKIARKLPVPIQTGGGIRKLADIDELMGADIHRVVIGTAALENPALLQVALDKFGVERIAVGIDARDGLVATKGWQANSTVDAIAFAKQVANAGIEWAVHTDISRDGMLTGLNLDATVALAQASGLKLIASGGVSTLEDVRNACACASAGVKGLIIGKALYEQRFRLEDALAIAESHSGE